MGKKAIRVKAKAAIKPKGFHGGTKAGFLTSKILLAAKSKEKKWINGSQDYQY